MKLGSISGERNRIQEVFAVLLEGGKLQDELLVMNAISVVVIVEQRIESGKLLGRHVPAISGLQDIDVVKE